MNFYRTKEYPAWIKAYGVDRINAKGMRRPKVYLYDYMSEHPLLWNRFPFKPTDKIIFDVSDEGYSATSCPFAQKLDEYFTSHNFNLGNVFLVTGNLRQKEYYNGGINIVELCHWDTGGYNMYVNGVEPSYLQNRIDNLQHANKNFIYLSRVPRPDRTMLTRQIFENELLEDNIISHDVIECDGTPFTKRLPIIADTTDFQTNWANYLCEDVHMPALFSVVGETMQNDYEGTSMFFSEKTFRPMYLGMPMLIWGQPGCNNFLSNKLGYRPYTKWFDYSFDAIQNTRRRCEELTKQLVSLNKMLNSMTSSQRMSWALQDIETLEYNMKRTRYNEMSMNNFNEMIEKINVR